jgi:hypothetical protein
MGDKLARTPQERDPEGTKRVAAHGDYRRQNIEMRGEDEGKDYSTDGGGIRSNSKQGTMRSPPADTSGKTAGEYGKAGPGSPKGTIGWPFKMPTTPMDRNGFSEPE